LDVSQLRICRPPLFLLRSGENFMKDAECAESKKNYISDFSYFYFLSYGENSLKVDYILSTKMTIARKIKIGEI